MGNKTNPIQKNQAAQALLSGENGLGGAFSQTSNKVIRIKLIQLNQHLPAAIQINQAVTVKWKIDGFYCFIKNQSLGKIPANYNDMFNDSTTYRGVIVEFKQEPFSVTIEVSL